MADTSEWVLDDGNNKSNSKSSNEEWILDNNSQSNNNSQESLLTSVGMAPFRILGDVGEGAYGFIKKTPEYYEKAKTEVPGVMGLGLTHPIHGFGQALAGTNELINSLAQLPKNLSSYGENRLNLLPKGMTDLINKITPEDTTESINQIFGKPKYPGEELLRGGIKNIPQIAGGIGLAKLLNPARYTSENIAKNITNKKSMLREKYSDKNIGLYPVLFKDARTKGYGNVNINPKNIRISEIEEFANPKYTESVKKLLNNNDIENAQSAQSDLKKYINFMDSKISLTKPEQKSLKAAKDAQQHIVDKMFEGNKVLKERYNKITSGYEKEYIPYKNPKIKQYEKGKLKSKELIPELKKGEFAATRGKYHPELFRKDQLRNALIGLGIAGFGTSGAKSIFDLFYGR